MIVDHENGLFLKRNDLLGERDWRDDDCYKLIYAPLGSGKYQTGTNDVSIEAGNFLMLNPNQKHRQLHATGEKFVVEIEGRLLKHVAEQLGINPPTPEFALMSQRNQHILNWLGFVREYLSISPNALFVENSLTQIAILLLEHAPGAHSVELPLATENLSQTTSAIRESYTDDWTLDQMAVEAGLSKYQFAHQFKKETGLSPYSWLQLYRLIKSQQLLIQTDRSILSIALEVGFRNITSYNHLFRKVYGRTPTEFRLFYRKNS